MNQGWKNIFAIGNITDRKMGHKQGLNYPDFGSHQCLHINYIAILSGQRYYWSPVSAECDAYLANEATIMLTANNKSWKSISDKNIIRRSIMIFYSCWFNGWI
ncbi:hypothetical protein ACET3Z_002968 [Daucus carota]